MSKNVKPVLEQDYVYNADGTGEFRSVNVSLGITEMEEIVTLKSEQNMTFGEVERVLVGFEEDIMARMGMKLEGSYPARLEYKGKVFKIAFGDNRNVKGIVPL
jgi:hypothetical protein